MSKALLAPFFNRSKQVDTSPPVPYSMTTSSHSFGLQNDGSGDQKQNMSSMASVSTIYAIINLLSTSTAAVTWHLYRKSPSGRVENRVEIFNHAALDVWNAPNRWYTRQEFMETGQQHIDLTGECWWVLERSALGFPLSVWPVRPDRIRVVESAEDFVAGYVYTGPGGEQVPLSTDQVISIRMPNPLNPFRGLGPVQSILMDAQSIHYATQWNKNFFLNGAEPGGIIEYPANLRDDEFDEARKRWNEQHRGASNAHRVAIIEAGKWVDRKYSHTDMGFAQLREISDKAIRTAFAVHPHMLGLSEDVNLANATAAEITFARRQTVPRLERWKGALNNDFLPMFGDTSDLEFDYDNPVKEDESTSSDIFLSRAKGANLLVLAGFDGAEVATVAGFPDMDWSEDRVTRSNTEIVADTNGVAPTAQEGSTTGGAGKNSVTKNSAGKNSVELSLTGAELTKIFNRSEW